MDCEKAIDVRSEFCIPDACLIEIGVARRRIQEQDLVENGSQALMAVERRRHGLARRDAHRRT